MRPLPAVLAVAAGACSAHADPLVADRPDFTESASAVEAGRLQLEMGYTAVVDDGDTQNYIPEPLLRIGVLEGVELRIAWGGVYFDGERSEGTDFGLAFKYVLPAPEDDPLRLGFILGVSLPTGGSETSAEVVVPGLKLLWSYALTDRLSVAGNLNFGAPESSEGRRIGESQASLALALSLTEEIGAFVEYFGIYPWQDDAAENYMDGGFTFLLNDNLQLDIRVGVGLNASADDFFAGAGLSVRF